MPPGQVFTAYDFLKEGLRYVQVPVEMQQRRSSDNNWADFKHHYGAAPTVVAIIWGDLCTTEIDEWKLSDKEKGQKGMGRLLMVFYFMWNYPRNRQHLARRFGVCDNYASGKQLWKWASRVAALASKVIFFPEYFSDTGPDAIPFIITVDCRDHKCSEKKHPRYNLDTAYASKKHGFHASLKYELAVAIHTDQIVWISGPYKASKHDLTIFREGGLKQKMIEEFPDKFVIVDLGYESSKPDELMLVIPASCDPKELKKYKSLARCREEDVNGRMAKWKVLSHEFEHSVQSHKICHTFVAVTLQYQLNHGDAYLFKV